MGRIGNLHQLRQMRSGLPDRRAIGKRKIRFPSEMAKNGSSYPTLTVMREGKK